MPLKDTPGYDCVIIDEFHHSAASTYRKLNAKAWSDVYYRIGLTATPFRSQDNERLLLESILSKIIYRVEHKAAVEKGYIVPVEAYYIEVPKQQVEGMHWREVYSELVVNNDIRNELICTILTSLVDAGKKTLCLVKEINHGNKIAESTLLHFANGEAENTRELISNFNGGLHTGLIGTTGVLGEGIDTKPAEYIIIAGLGKSKNSIMQSAGRGFRKYPGKESCKIILFRDTSHKWTKAHFNAQCKYLLEEYGIKPTRIILD